MFKLPSGGVDTVAAASAVTIGTIAFVSAKLWVNMKTTAGTMWAQRHSTGLAGFFLQHMPDVMYLKPSGQAELEWAATARAQGRTAVCLCMGVGTVTYIPVDPADLEYVLITNGQNYVKTPMYENLKLFMGKLSLVTERNEAVHGVKRRMLNPAFRPAALRSISRSVFVPHVTKLIAALMGAATKGASSSSASATPVDMEQQFNDASLDIIAEAAFHCESDAQKAEVRRNFTEQNAVLIAAPYVILPQLLHAPTKAKAALVRLLERQRNVALNIIRVAKDALAAPAAERDANSTAVEETKLSSNATSLMDILVGMDGLSNDEIADHALTFLFAGQDTTSGTLTWAAYALALYPRVQKALLEELSSVVGLGQAPVIDSVQNLPYLENFIKEVLRVYPAVAGVGRAAEKDDLLPSGVVIPGGSKVWISIISMHMHPAIYGPDAQAFRPERWEDPSLAARVGQVGWMPFSLGKRNCIGKDFAMQEMKMILAVVVRNFELGLQPGAPEPWRQQGITMRPAKRIPFTLARRSADG